MACILHIETATEVCSVALSKDGEVIFECEDRNGPSHATLLGLFVSRAMEVLRNNKLELDAVAVSCGPGSYTGLRIGVSEAKGLCFGLDIPLIAIGTLRLLAYTVLQRKLVDESVLLCPMIDARRMEVYDELFDTGLNQLRDVSADIIDENSFADYLGSNKIAFFGNGAAKCKDSLQSANAIFLDDVYPKASYMISLAEEAFHNNDYVDTAYFEPFYLKEFVATVAKNKVLSSR